MIVVLDTSAAVKVVLQTADQSLIEALTTADKVIAPELFVAEVNNTFWKYSRFEQLPVETCEFLIDKALQLVDEFLSIEKMHQEAFALAIQTEISVYDALFLVAARRQNAYLITADKRLHDVATNLSIRII